MTIQMTREHATRWTGVDLLEVDFDTLAQAAEQGYWVEAAPFRAHVRHLMGETGVAWRTIAVLADVPSSAVEHLLRGRNGRPLQRLHPLIAERLFHLTRDVVADAASRPMLAASTRRLLELLASRGWRIDEVARRTRLPEAELAAVAAGHRVRCNQLLAATVKAAAQALWDQSAPAPNTINQTPARRVASGVVPSQERSRSATSNAVTRQAGARTGGRRRALGRAAA